MNRLTDGCFTTTLDHGFGSGIRVDARRSRFVHHRADPLSLQSIPTVFCNSCALHIAHISLLFIALIALLTGCSPVNKDRLPIPEGGLRFITDDMEGIPADQSIFSSARLTLLVIFSTECGPCAAEMPVLKQLSDRYADHGMQVVGIAADHETSSAKDDLHAFVAPAGASFRVLLYRPSMADTFLRDVKRVPVHFWIDSNGHVL